jgi:hypothetical protein
MACRDGRLLKEQLGRKVDLTAKLHLTQKGIDEIKLRKYKLSIRKRSVLLFLEKPQAVERLLDKTVFHQDEIVYEAQALLQDGFIAGDSDSSPELVAISHDPEDIFQLNEDIILSKAKFMLIDYCVDCFGTQSEVFDDAIRACKNTKSLGKCLTEIFTAAKKKCPDRLPALLDLIKKINETT